MRKCSDLPSPEKGLRLEINDSPDSNNLSEPLTVDFKIQSGAAECLDNISAVLQNPHGARIQQPITLYGLAGAVLAQDLPAAVLSLTGGAGALALTNQGGALKVLGDLPQLTIFIPAGTTPAPAAPGKILNIQIVFNDDINLGGFLTEPHTVQVTLHYLEVARHSDLEAFYPPGGTIPAAVNSVLPVIRESSSPTPVPVLLKITVTQPFVGEALVKVAGELDFITGAAAIESNTNPTGQTLSLILKASDGEDDLEARTRPDRLYTVRARYLIPIQAAAVSDKSKTIISGIEAITVSSEFTGNKPVALITMHGGAGGLILNAPGLMQLAGNTLFIPEGVSPGRGSAVLLTTTIKINDNENFVGGLETSEKRLTLTVEYSALSPLALKLENKPRGEIVTIFGNKPREKIVATVLASGGAGGPYNITQPTGDLYYDSALSLIKIPGEIPVSGQLLSAELIVDDGGLETATLSVTVRYAPTEPLRTGQWFSGNGDNIAPAFFAPGVTRGSITIYALQGGIFNSGHSGPPDRHCCVIIRAHGRLGL